MKKVLKILGIIIGLLLLIIIGIALYVNIAGIPSYENRAPEEYPVETDSASVAEGARMATMLCANCHRASDGTLGGGEMKDAPQFGKLFAPNITRHPEASKLMPYSPGELVYLLRTGIKRDGSYAPPYMAKIPLLSEEDMKDLIAFLYSDHPMLRPSDKVQPPCEPSFLTKALTRFLIKPLPYPTEAVPEPDKSNTIEYGRYLSVAKFDCFQCHSADFKSNDPMVPENSIGYFAGGNPLLDLDGNLILSPNLTMDGETGLGKWTEEQFITAVKTGIRPHGKPANKYPMATYPNLYDEEAKAIWAYLNTLEPVRNDKLMAQE